MNEYKIKWGWWISAIATVPVVVWVITLIPMPYNPAGYLVDERDWIAFFGGYTGACIGILMTLFVLRSTLRQNASNLGTTITENKNNLDATLNQNQANHKELVVLQNTTNDKNEELNRQNREQNEKLNRRQQQLQINTTLYVQEQANIEKLRNMLDENYRTVDFQRFAIAINYMQLGNFEYSNQLLLSIGRDVEMSGAKSDMYLPLYRKDESEEEMVYRELFKKVMVKYGVLVNDFIFVNSLLIFLREKMPLINTVHEYTRNSYEAMKKHVSLDSVVANEYNSDDNIYEDILRLKAKKEFKEIVNDINDAIYQRLNKVITAHVNKTVLLNAAQNLLAYREGQAKKILIENLE